MTKPPPPEMRRQLIDALRDALQTHPRVRAAWESGHATYGRVDAWSEIEFVVVVADGATDEAVVLVKHIIESIVTIRRGIQVCGQLAVTPHEPPPPECPRMLYRLDDFGLHVLIDCEIVPQHHRERLQEIVRHGRIDRWFDHGAIIGTHVTDRRAMRARLAKVLEQVRARHEMLAALPRRELRRGNAIDALHLYRGLLLEPLIMLFRMRYNPYRYDCDMRFLRDDLPADQFRFVKELAFVSHLDDLSRKIEMAIHEIERQLADINLDHLDWTPPLRQR